jgi:hypothetical protein
MKNNDRWRHVLVPLALSLLAACTAAGPDARSQSSLPSSGEVASLCLARAAVSNEPTPAVDHLTGSQWRRYVSCALTSNKFVDTSSVLDNPEAIVSLRLNPDGSVNSATLLRTSGNAALDAAVQRAITAASP